MNERIKELIEQAEFEENDGHISIQGVYMFNTTRMEKFAELIVKECAKFMDENSGYNDSDGCWFPEPEDMLKHFGVEE